MSEKIDFRCFNLLVDRVIAERDAFSGLSSFTTTLESDDGINEIKTYIDDRCIWFVGNKGKNQPYSAEVYNRDTKEKTPNPRSENEVELRNQWFAMYHFSMKTLYLTFESKNTIQTVLSNQLKKSIIVKNVYKTKEQFLEELEKIKSIRFIAKQDLLTNITNLFQDTSDDLGLGNPKQIKMSVEYSYVDKTAKFVNMIKKLFSRYESGGLTSLIVVGSRTEDDNTVESLFNIKNIGESIRVMCEKDERGMFDADQVKTALLEKITSKGE